MLYYDRLPFPRNHATAGASIAPVAGGGALRVAAVRQKHPAPGTRRPWPGGTYRTLDDFATLAAAQSNPESLLETPAIINEVQRCPELLVALKKSVDEQRRPGQFISSGSANLALLGHVTETLAGYDRVQSRCCARREDGKFCALLLRLLRRRSSSSSLRRVLNTLSFTTGGHDPPSLSQSTPNKSLTRSGKKLP
jgi:hypothetical protein